MSKCDQKSHWAEVERRVDNLLQDTLSPKRYRHSHAVADRAGELARLFDLPVDKSRLAGLAHDLAREWDREKLLEIAAIDGAAIDDDELRYPMLLHGRAAAVVISRDFATSDEEILRAIRHHTRGDPNMGALEKIIYCADRISRDRKRATPELLLSCFKQPDINHLVAKVLDCTIKNRKISKPTQELYEAVQREIHANA